eukprot:TRINITY_DN29988_c0_g1_i1.p1 TRINITY_DN29988_c0_g1~~TRINITY_DN29988_c0_g1_i1.p1  ORF type:complete len:867 (+),score=188.37 TRINITY_DN29988_c0_g1_i1:118-2718(+)
MLRSLVGSEMCIRDRVWNEPEYAARVISVLDHLRYFCASDTLADQPSHRLCLPAAPGWGPAGPQMTVQSWDGDLPVEQWREFVLPKPRQGIDRSMSLIEKELRISPAGDTQEWQNMQAYAWDRMHVLNDSRVRVWLSDGTTAEHVLCDIQGTLSGSHPLISGQRIRLVPVETVAGPLGDQWLNTTEPVTVSLASRAVIDSQQAKHIQTACLPPLPYRPPDRLANWDPTGRYDLVLASDNAQIRAQLQMEEFPQVLDGQSSWSVFSWCQQQAITVCSQWTNAATETILQNVAAQLPAVESLHCVVGLFARLARVVSHKHWFDNLHTAAMQGDCDCEYSDLLAHTMNPTRAGGDSWPGYSNEQQCLQHYEEVFEEWRKKQHTCVLPCATAVYQGALRILQACRAERSGCFDAQGSAAALQLIGRCTELLWAVGCVRSSDQTPLEASLELVALLHQLQLLSVGNLGETARTVWYTECAVGSYDGTSALLELMHQLLVSPVHEDWRKMHAVRMCGALKDLRLMLFAPRNECWTSRPRDADPAARWRITHASVCLVLDALSLYLDAEPGSSQKQAWFELLSDVDLGLGLTRLLLVLWGPLQACGGIVLQEVLETLLLLILTLLRCDELKHVILDHILSEDYHRPKAQGMYSSSAIEDCDPNSLTPSPEVIVGEIAKYAGHLESSKEQLEQLALRILTELACVKGIPQRNGDLPSMLPLHQWLSLGRVRGVPEWRDIVVRVCGEAKLEDYNPAAGHSAALLFRLVRLALASGNSLGLLLCMPTEQDPEQGKLMRFAYDVVADHLSWIVNDPRLLTEALLLIESHTLALRGSQNNGGSFVLLLEDHLPITTQASTLREAVSYTHLTLPTKRIV